MWVCEWSGDIVRGGIFAVRAGHFIEAKQIARLIVRDVLAPEADKTFWIREANLTDFLRSLFGLLPEAEKSKIPARDG